MPQGILSSGVERLQGCPELPQGLELGSVGTALVHRWVAPFRGGAPPASEVNDRSCPEKPDHHRERLVLLAGLAGDAGFQLSEGDGRPGEQHFAGIRHARIAASSSDRSVGSSHPSLPARPNVVRLIL
jgi:hypothetical protein